jgi:endonuclease/exonuclease/phosphatase (EEP) superfamily protein YafD
MAGFRGREAQIQAICGYIDQWQAPQDGSDSIPVIVAGDFNMGEFSDAYRCMGERMTDAFKRVGLGYGFTWPSGELGIGSVIGLLFQTRIDYIFHSSHWRTAEAQTLSTSTGSDHRVVVVTLAVDD